MKKFLLLFIIATACLTKVGAQATTGVFSKGTNVLSGGVGIGGYYNYNALSNGYSQTPSYILMYENSTVDFGSAFLGLGGMVLYQSTSNSWTDGYNYSDGYDFELVAFRPAYHYRVRSAAKLDLYAGLIAGYLFYQHHFTTNDPLVDHPFSPGYTAWSGLGSESHFQFGVYAGGRYYFGNTVGIYAEIDIMNNAVNYIGLGVCFRFQ